MENTFKLQGRMIDANGQGIPGLFLVIVDEDFLRDDLIGMGSTQENGDFQISFLASEFQQDLLDIESTPDVKIVASQMSGEIRKVVFNKSFPNLVWKNQSADLGDILFEDYHAEKPKFLEGIEPLPGYHKRAQRVDIDNDLIRYCLAEVAPLVEHFTGWTNLMEDVKVEVADSLTPYMLRESYIGAGQDPNSSDAKFAAFFANFFQGSGAGCALYDPHIHTIVINNSLMKHVGLEGLKVICGHELVHLGQYKYTPGLKEYNLHHLRSMRVEENVDLEKAKAKAAYMTILEGYAQYIQQDFLQKHYYQMAYLSYHASTFEKIMQALMAMSADNVEESRTAKAAQYTDGIEIYRKQQIGDQAVPFHLDVSTLLGGEAFV